MRYADQTDCSGIGFEDVYAAAAITFVCGDVGESCDYGVTRTCTNGCSLSTGACLGGDYAETAVFVNQCTDATDEFSTKTTKTTCTATTATTEVYLSADCSGTAVSEEVLT